jgi:hypothetical protein
MMCRLLMIAIIVCVGAGLKPAPTLAAELAYDINGDDMINLLDWELFASGWLVAYDANDLVGFADEWLGYGGSCDGAPVALAQTVRYGSGDDVTITLGITGDYSSISIESLPANGALLSDGNSIDSVPFPLDSAEVIFDPSGQSDGTFSFSATDNITPPCGGSTTAHVTIVWSKPAAANISYTVETGVGERLVFDGSDPDDSGHLRYIITGFDGGLDIIDPLGGPVYETPWTMMRDVDKVICGGETSGSYSLTYKVSDETFVSEAASASITVSANSEDALFFSGGEDQYLSLPDAGTQFDLVDGRAIWFFVKTAQRSGCVLKKRGSQAGYELWIDNHVPVLRLYDPNGVQCFEQRFENYDLGISRMDNHWCQIGFNYQQKAVEGTELIGVLAYTKNDGNLTYDARQGYYMGIPDNDYSNDEPLVIMRGVRGGFDALRFYNGYDPENMTSAIISTQGRYVAGSSSLYVSPATVTYQFRGSNYLQDSTLAYQMTANGDVSRVPIDYYYYSIFAR